MQMASTETSVGLRLEPSWASASGSSEELHLELILPCFFDSFLVDRDVVFFFFQKIPTQRGLQRRESTGYCLVHI